jgi:CheY-like chemotaxis protein
MPPPPAPQQNEPKGHEGPLVLVVDDDLAQRKVIRRLLEQKHYRVVTVESSLHAIEVLWELEDLACVVSDQRMRGPSGAALLDYVAQERRSVGRVLYTAYSDGDLAADIGERHSIVEKVTPERLAPTVAFEIEHRRRVFTPRPA